METGIYQIPVAEYDAIEAVRSTRLKTIAQLSPLHYRHEQQDEDEDDPSTAMMLGTATHMAVLEPDRYGREAVVYSGAARRGAAWEAFERLHRGKVILTSKEADVVKGMALAVRDDPLAARYLAHCLPEVTAVWTDPGTSIRCKARFDGLDESDPQSPVVVGLKTARGAGPDAFARQASDLLYHLQWSHYREGYHAVRGIWPTMIEIAVEKTPPFDVVVYEIDETTIGAGDQLRTLALQTLAECERSNSWPGQGKGEVHTLKLKPWALGVPQDVELDWGKAS